MTQTLMLLPQRDFDPTEASVPWRVLTEAGHVVHFATEDGTSARCDASTLTGAGLAPWGLVLRAKPADVVTYEEMAASPGFQAPLTWSAVDPADYGALVLPGGHAPGMKPYLESEEVRRIIRNFFERQAPVAAVCHGVLAVARTTWPATGRSVLFGRRTTGLNNLQEKTAITLTMPFLGNHYATYPVTVQDEVTALLESPEHFEAGPALPRFGTAERPEVGFVVVDGTYVSARWPGDVHRWSTVFRDLLAGLGCETEA